MFLSSSCRLEPAFSLLSSPSRTGIFVVVVVGARRSLKTQSLSSSLKYIFNKYVVVVVVVGAFVVVVVVVVVVIVGASFRRKLAFCGA